MVALAVPPKSDNNSLTKNPAALAKNFAMGGACYPGRPDDGDAPPHRDPPQARIFLRRTFV